MSRAVKFEPDAREDFNDWLGQDVKTAKRICTLLKEARRNPFEGTGNYQW